MSEYSVRAALAMLVAALMLAGCGGGSSSDGGAKELPRDAVASVDGRPIARTELTVRERFEAVQASQQVPLRGGARSKLPPVFPYLAPERRCAAAVRRAIDPKQGSKLSDAKLRDYCKATAARIREYSVNALLAARVTAGEAAERGIAVTAADVDSRLRTLYAAFGGPANLVAYTRRTGLTRNDLRDKAREGTIATKLRSAILLERARVTEVDMRREFLEHRDRYPRSYDKAKPLIRRTLAASKPQRAWSAWQDEVIKRWRPRIECREGYDLVSLCGHSGRRAAER